MIEPLEARFGALIAALEPAARRVMAREIARQLRQSQSRRIADQLNPDGSAFAPRKPQLRHRKKSLRAGMFRRLRTTTYLKASGSADQEGAGYNPYQEEGGECHRLLPNASKGLDSGKG